MSFTGHNILHTYVQNTDGDYSAHGFTFEDFLALANQSADPPHLMRAKDPGPDYGILTKCLVPSPIIKYVLRGSIRCGEFDYRDVIFVGERHIELRQLDTERACLDRLAIKHDFFCKIRSAAVIGRRRKRQETFDSSGKKREVPRDFPSTFLASPASDYRSSPDDVQLPAQLLVLSMESGDIAFVYCVESEFGKIDFKISTHRVSPERPIINHVGKAIAVDPYSRAFAVCSWEGYFRVYSMHDRAVVEKQVLNGEPIMPLREEISYTVPGTIIHLEFLYPEVRDGSTSAPDQVIFIVVFVSKKETRVMLYEWTTTQPLREAKKLSQKGLKLPKDMGIPLHVVPLTIPTWFCFICEYDFYVGMAQDIVSGQTFHKKVPIPSVVPGAYQYNRQLVTNWARAPRNHTYGQTRDDFYIAKENGETFWIGLRRGGFDGTSIQTTSTGKIEGSVGSAFAFCDPGPLHFDLLLVGGETSPGGLYMITPMRPKQEPRLRPVQLQELSNWAPTFDATIADVENTRTTNSAARRNRLYACSGFGEHGSVVEMRHGIESRALVDVEKSGTIRKIWVLHGLAERGIHILISFLTQTSLWYVDFDDIGVEDVGAASELDIGEGIITIAAGVWDNSAVQIMTDKIISVRLDAMALSAEDTANDLFVNPRKPWLCNEGETISNAVIKENIAILVINGGEKCRIQAMLITPSSTELVTPMGEAVNSVSHPTFVDFLEIEYRYIVIVGNQDQTFTLYEVLEGTGLVQVLQQSTADAEVKESAISGTQQESPVCESACIIYAENIPYLLCGLRNGYVVQWVIDLKSLAVSEYRSTRIGRLPVQLSRRQGQTSKVLVQTTYQLFEITVVGGNLIVTPVILDTQHEPVIEAIAPVYHDFNIGPLPLAMLCATEGSFMLSVYGGTNGIYTRQIKLEETPSKILYHPSEDLLVVACHRLGPADPYAQQLSEVRDRRSEIRCTLKFIDPISGDSKAPRDLKDSKKGELLFTNSCERINCLANWTFEVGGKSCRCILIGTSIFEQKSKQIRGQASRPQQQSKSWKGRILILSVGYAPSDTERKGSLSIRRRNQIPYPEPVHCIAPVGERSIVFGSHTALCMVTLNPDTLKFSQVMRYELHTVPRSITVDDNLIWLSSANDILTVYKWDDDIRNFTRLYSDDRERRGEAHIMIDNDFFLAADRDDGIVGLWKPKERRASTSLVKPFEAYLPNSIATIRKGDLRAAWNPRGNPFGVVHPEFDIIGTCFDGSIYHFTLLTPEATKLLRFLQDVYLKILDRNGLSKPIDRRESATEKEVNRKHVDGGILAKVRELGVGWIEHVNSESYGVLKECAVNVFGKEEINRKGTVKLVEEYLRELLDAIVL